MNRKKRIYPCKEERGEGRGVRKSSRSWRGRGSTSYSTMNKERIYPGRGEKEERREVGRGRQEEK